MLLAGLREQAYRGFDSDGPCRVAVVQNGIIENCRTLLAERAFHALCLLEGSPRPAGRCIDCKQTSLFGANPQRTRSSAAALS